MVLVVEPLDRVNIHCIMAMSIWQKQTNMTHGFVLNNMPHGKTPSLLCIHYQPNCHFSLWNKTCTNWEELKQRQLKQQNLLE